MMVKADFGKLDKFVAGLGEKHFVKIGIFGNKTERREVDHTGAGGKIITKTRKVKAVQTNAELGAIHEFGSFTKHIPARSFLRMPIQKRSESILAGVEKVAKYFLGKGDMIGLLTALGFECENAIQRAFESRGFGTWKENAPSTIRRKGSSAPLIDSAQLRRSIASKVG